MDLNKNNQIIFGLILLFTMTCKTSQLYAQFEEQSDEIVTVYEDDFEPEEQDVVKPREQALEVTPATNYGDAWNDQQWTKAKEGIDFTKPEDQKKKKEIEEEEDTITDSDASATNFGDWLFETITSPIGKLIAILFIISLLMFMILRLMNGRSMNGKEKIPSQNAIFWENPEEIPEESDMEKFLKHAFESADYKTSVRILYLIIISNLNENNWINWKKDKTNRDYLNEMRASNYYNGFRDLTLIYEVIWYGDKNISRNEFTRLNVLFQNYKSAINGEEEKK